MSLSPGPTRIRAFDQSENSIGGNRPIRGLEIDQSFIFSEMDLDGVNCRNGQILKALITQILSRGVVNNQQINVFRKN